MATNREKRGYTIQPKQVHIHDLLHISHITTINIYNKTYTFNYIQENNKRPQVIWKTDSIFKNNQPRNTTSIIFISTSNIKTFSIGRESAPIEPSNHQPRRTTFNTCLYEKKIAKRLLTLANNLKNEGRDQLQLWPPLMFHSKAESRGLRIAYISKIPGESNPNNSPTISTLVSFTLQVKISRGSVYVIKRFSILCKLQTLTILSGVRKKCTLPFH